MAVLHKEFIDFNGSIKLSKAKRDGLKSSRDELRKKIRNWFKENKSGELQPVFSMQGSFAMNTTVNPILKKDDNGSTLYDYDLDDGVYFIEKNGEDNRRSISTFHDWIYSAVDTHTGQPTIRKASCVRVQFADGHHIDIPIYYKEYDVPELAHKSQGWIESDPRAFYRWFNKLKTSQLERIVRYLKAWKNYREDKNTSLNLPSGFALTILAANHYTEKENDDEALFSTVETMLDELERSFQCLRPTIPEGEDVFSDYSETRKDNFLETLKSLKKDLARARAEPNFKKATEILRANQFGNRLPLGKDEEEGNKNSRLKSKIASAIIPPKPYGF
tara:strand:- start:11109 stop:12104 length:996 start_codon:yes stop_codon:yes gene_type:complete